MVTVASRVTGSNVPDDGDTLSQLSVDALHDSVPAPVSRVSVTDLLVEVVRSTSVGDTSNCAMGITGRRSNVAVAVAFTSPILVGQLNALWSPVVQVTPVHPPKVLPPASTASSPTSSPTRRVSSQVGGHCAVPMLAAEIFTVPVPLPWRETVSTAVAGGGAVVAGAGVVGAEVVGAGLTGELLSRGSGRGTVGGGCRLAGGVVPPVRGGAVDSGGGAVDDDSGSAGATGPSAS